MVSANPSATSRWKRAKTIEARGEKRAKGKTRTKDKRLNAAATQAFLCHFCAAVSLAVSRLGLPRSALSRCPLAHCAK
jgi:hypothetical protein